MVAKIEWHDGELFPRIGFMATNFRLPAGKVVKVYSGHDGVENRIKQGRNTLRWEKTRRHRCAADQALAHGIVGLQPPAHALAIPPGRRRGQTVNGVADQAFAPSGGNSCVSRPEVECSCGFSFPLGPVLPRFVRVTSSAEKTVDGATEGDVHSESG